MRSNYSVEWDKPHEPGDSSFWQESDAYWFYDLKQGIGGFHRIGQKPHSGVGNLTLFAFCKGGERFVMSAGERTEVALGKGARQEFKQVVGSHAAEALGDARMRYTWQETECTGDLEFYDPFYMPRDWTKSGHSDDFMSNLNADGHLECSGRLRGTIRIGDSSYQIDALAHRDRSWGLRDVARASMHRYRMFTGTVGPELSFACFLLDLHQGPKMVAGFARVNGSEYDVVDLRVITTLDFDGLTPLATVGILTLENGETLRIETSSVQGFMTPVPEAKSVSQDHISTFVYKGMEGFMDLEHCINPGRGSHVPTQEESSLVAIDQGLSKYVEYQW
jgi:hypothetical protein